MPDGRSMRSCDPETNYTPIDSGRMCLAASETPSPVNYQAPASSNERAGQPSLHVCCQHQLFNCANHDVGRVVFASVTNVISQASGQKQ